MKVLIACEFSGIVRDEFIAAGHDAISCDLLPTEKPGPHVQGDVTTLLQEPWDLVIAHPPCTYLCNSGVRWLHEREGRWELMENAANFFKKCLEANASSVAVENPVMHKYAVAIIGRKQNFSVQPWMFGEPYKKRTCFWTRGLPLLMATKNLGPEGCIQQTFLESPGPDRWKNRSRTYLGIAKAMALQWGSV